MNKIKQLTTIEDPNLEPYFITKDDHCYTVQMRVKPNSNHFRTKGKVKEYINSLRRFVQLMDDKIGPSLSWTAAPQLKDEKENDLLPIEVYPNKDRDVKIS